MGIVFGILCGLFLAYANGANDNFKGVATLFGSRTVGFRWALGLATVATLAGSLCAALFARELLATFSGKGLVPDEIAGLKAFALSVGLAAALTVMLATFLGFPISTTHALTGALVGAGLVATGSGGVDFHVLGVKFLVPLLLSPVLAILGAAFLFPLFRFLRIRLGVERDTCLCIGKEVRAVAPAGCTLREARAFFETSAPPEIVLHPQSYCADRYRGRFLGIAAAPALDALHFLSASAVSFARGLNDAPKIAAILLVGQALSPRSAILGVAVAMAIGGVLQCRKVADTMSNKVTDMNAGQGFTANLTTSFLVIFASRLGVPVSTTHVSCGSLFGIGVATGQGHWRTIAGILLAWVVTLPVAGVLGAALFWAVG